MHHEYLQYYVQECLLACDRMSMFLSDKTTEHKQNCSKPKQNMFKCQFSDYQLKKNKKNIFILYRLKTKHANACVC